MELLSMEKIKDGKYLKSYELTYLNKSGKEKKYEIVSRRELRSPEDIGKVSSGVSVICLCEGKLLLLYEFRMGVNQRVYNLCAGMIEDGEKLENCIRRELMEESGLILESIVDILPPSFAAVAISDTVTNIAIVKAKGTLNPMPSDNEDIIPKLFTKEEVCDLLKTEKFSSRAQISAYMFSIGAFDNL